MSEQNNQPKKTPNQEVAELITAALRDKHLLSENNLRDLARKLASGTISASDWKIMFLTELKNGHGKE